MITVEDIRFCDFDRQLGLENSYAKKITLSIALIVLFYLPVVESVNLNFETYANHTLVRFGVEMKLLLS